MQVTVSSALAINVLKMVKQNVVVKRLSAVQTLGSVTVICTDKTGTITKGEMTVNKLWVYDYVSGRFRFRLHARGRFHCKRSTTARRSKQLLWRNFLRSLRSATEQKLIRLQIEIESWSVIGDPTDGALLVAALKSSVNIQDALAAETDH